MKTDWQGKFSGPQVLFFTINQVFLYTPTSKEHKLLVSPPPTSTELSSNLQQVSSGLLLTRKTNHVTSIRQCCACASRVPIIHEVTNPDQLQPRGVKQHPLIRTYTCIRYVYSTPMDFGWRNAPLRCAHQSF